MEEISIKKTTAQGLEWLSGLYDTYAPALLGVATRIAGGGKKAEDILQQAFVEIWNTRQTHNQSRESIFIWMMNITRRISMEKMLKPEPLIKLDPKKK